MNALLEIIQSRIREGGPVSFEEFMELALYHPQFGYYEKDLGQIGRRGDFYTSVSTGSLFGELLAFQFASWLREIPPSERPFQLVEAGAHDATLAGDILSWLQTARPDVFSRTEYWIVEPSARRRARQEQALNAFSGAVHWAGSLGQLPRVCGVIFCNELLDAFPVRRFAWERGRREWQEMGVGVDENGLAWTRLKTSAGGPAIDPALGEVLPDGFLTETATASAAWWKEAASKLVQGRLLTFDYGLRDEEFFHPGRVAGTLRAYQKHRLSADLLANPGEQDLTAHLRFDGIIRAGESFGLVTEIFEMQGQFLAKVFAAAASEPVFASLSSGRIRQFQTLVHPEYLGEKFRVLCQKRLPF